jgi:hypothetical protein
MGAVTSAAIMDNTVTAADISDEPGVNALGTGSFSAVTVMTGVMPGIQLGSVNINCPANGVVRVTIHGWLQTTSPLAQINTRIWVDQGTMTSGPVNEAAFTTTSGTTVLSFSAERTFVCLAGPNTFSAWANSTSTASLTFTGHLSATYFPTTY